MMPITQMSLPRSRRATIIHATSEARNDPGPVLADARRTSATAVRFQA